MIHLSILHIFTIPSIPPITTFNGPVVSNLQLSAKASRQPLQIGIRIFTYMLSRRRDLQKPISSISVEVLSAFLRSKERRGS